MSKEVRGLGLGVLEVRVVDEVESMDFNGCDKFLNLVIFILPPLMLNPYFLRITLPLSMGRRSIDNICESLFAILSCQWVCEHRVDRVEESEDLGVPDPELLLQVNVLFHQVAP